MTSAMTSFFLVAYTTMTGVQQIDRPVLEAAPHFGARGRRLFAKVLLPGAMPFIFTGMRLGLGYALIVVIAVEMVSAQQRARRAALAVVGILKVEDMYAALLVDRAPRRRACPRAGGAARAAPALAARRGRVAEVRVAVLVAPSSLLLGDAAAARARLAALLPAADAPRGDAGRPHRRRISEGGARHAGPARRRLRPGGGAGGAARPADGPVATGAERRRAVRGAPLPVAEDRAAAAAPDRARRGRAGLRADRARSRRSSRSCSARRAACRPSTRG